MEESIQDGPTESDLWDAVEVAMHTAMFKPTDANFVKVAERAMEWQRAHRALARGSTLNPDQAKLDAVGHQPSAAGEAPIPRGMTRTYHPDGSWEDHGQADELPAPAPTDE